MASPVGQERFGFFDTTLEGPSYVNVLQPEEALYVNTPKKAGVPAVAVPLASRVSTPLNPQSVVPQVAFDERDYANVPPSEGQLYDNVVQTSASSFPTRLARRVCATLSSMPPAYVNTAPHSARPAAPQAYANLSHEVDEDDSDEEGGYTKVTAEESTYLMPEVLPSSPAPVEESPTKRHNVREVFICLIPEGDKRNLNTLACGDKGTIVEGPSDILSIITTAKKIVFSSYIPIYSQHCIYMAPDSLFLGADEASKADANPIVINGCTFLLIAAKSVVIGNIEFKAPLPKVIIYCENLEFLDCPAAKKAQDYIKSCRAKQAQAVLANYANITLTNAKGEEQFGFGSLVDAPGPVSSIENGAVAVTGRRFSRLSFWKKKPTARLDAVPSASDASAKSGIRNAPIYSTSIASHLNAFAIIAFAKQFKTEQRITFPRDPIYDSHQIAASALAALVSQINSLTIKGGVTVHAPRVVILASAGLRIGVEKDRPVDVTPVKIKAEALLYLASQQQIEIGNLELSLGRNTDVIIKTRKVVIIPFPAAQNAQDIIKAACAKQKIPVVIKP